jgi:hypothetical protein
VQTGAQPRRNEKLRVKHPASLHRTELPSEWASATRSTVDPRPGPFAAVGSTATHALPLCQSGAHKRALSTQGPLRLLRTAPCYLRNCIPSITGATRISLVLGAQRGECRMPRGEGQEAGSCEPTAGCRRRRASLYQPMALRIANKAAAAVLLSVNRAG